MGCIDGDVEGDERGIVVEGRPEAQEAAASLSSHGVTALARLDRR